MVGISPHFSFDSRPFFGRCDQCTLWHPLRPSPWKAKFDCWWAKLGRARRGCVELCKRHVTQRRESWNLSTWNASLEQVKSTINITVQTTVSLTYVRYFNTYSQPSLPSQIIMTSKLQGRRSSLQMSKTSKAQIHRGTGYQWYQGIRGSTWQNLCFLPTKIPAPTSAWELSKS